jgi:hypothetical protein
MFGPGCLGQRIQAAAYGAIGSLPRALRGRAAHLWNVGNLTRLTEAMSHWIRGAELEKEQFAHLFFGRDADDPRVGLLHGAALNVSSAIDHDELSGGAEQIAAALQVIGLDRWPGFVADLWDRALDPATVAAIENSRDRGKDPEAERAIAADAIIGGIAAESHTVSGAIPCNQDDVVVTGRPEQIRMHGQSGGGVHPRTWGLPPPDIMPPVRNPGRLNPGNASRPPESWSGGKSLWDEHGGEWRYRPADAWNGSNWEYNKHAGPNSPWRNIPTGNLPTRKI